MPPGWAEAGIVGLRIFIGLGVPDERSMAVAVTVPMTMMVIVRMAVRVRMAGRADSGVLLENFKSSSMERPGISPGGLETGVR